MNNLLRVTTRYKNIFNFSECRRYAGHNKWSNIRHIKAAKDSEKATAMIQMIRNMKFAIAEGKSAKPEDNSKLAKLIELAKKKSMSMTTIKNFLDKQQNAKINAQTAIVETRGPSGTILLIHLVSDQLTHTRNLLNNVLKKSKFSSNEMVHNSSFEEKGIIITEVGEISIDKALEDAIEVGAEEAEKGSHENAEFFQFTCTSNDLNRIRNELENKNYKIIDADINFIPLVTVSLNEADINVVDKLYEKLNTIEEVLKVHDNVERDN